MLLTTTKAYESEPLYMSAMHHLQLGEWNEGLEELGQLVANNPNSADLAQIHTDMKFRARLEDDELVEGKLARRKKIVGWSSRLVILAVVLGLSYFAFRTYSGWLLQNWQAASQNITSEFQRVELSVKLREGQNLLIAGRVDMAETALQAVAAVDPNYPGLSETLQQIREYKALKDTYNQAQSLEQKGDLKAASELYQDISTKSPNFMDIQARSRDIAQQIDMEAQLARADFQFQAGAWADAAKLYESVRITDPYYKADLVDQRLYSSYTNAAQQLMNTNDRSIENLKAAEEYYRKALSLRPQDPAIQQQRDKAREKFSEILVVGYVQAAQTALLEQANSLEAMTIAKLYLSKALELRPNNSRIQVQEELINRYLGAQDDFAKSHWEDVIIAMEMIHDADPDYALGTARQTLFEAYLARGQSYMVMGKYMEALDDFERAAVLAEESQESPLRVYNAQIKIAEAKGLLGEIEEANQLYAVVIDELQLPAEKLRGNTTLRDNLERARKNNEAMNYKLAFKLYRENAPQALVVYASLVNYTVKAGDYLHQLANQFNTTISAILQANNLTNTNQVSIGDRLVIPKGRP